MLQMMMVLQAMREDFNVVEHILCFLPKIYDAHRRGEGVPWWKHWKVDHIENAYDIIPTIVCYVL